ncbi:glycoside hydrolase family 30 beta sandwich domain-containing protein [Lachnoclostridium sp. Marseille-P6806]|uniref:glycoside hydrolase family 30 beta sandwich domain-containing protein n=1 Tax=Lachnoclostridium sp. Marseille-P6806 TaxID=2364793 RepID=UPI00102FC4EA|nr:glycoside hydrolase family 30 beta sandwich domain-containing protein [Lachnoclostridium sp. Marseille-P6806]
MRTKKLFAGVIAMVVGVSVIPPIPISAAGNTVDVWVSQVNAENTGMAKGLEQQESLTFENDSGTRISNLIIVDESKSYQQMDGFGASITEASAHLYQSVLDNQKKSEVMNALFDKETGIGISMLRQTIGASDHCVGPYNFAQEAQGDSLPGFDFSHELEEIFPTVQTAMGIEPGRIKVMASSWSAPGWMKNNGSELGMYNNVRGTLRTDKYQAYANYLLKFIQNYENRGIHIYAITPTNEPDHASYDWPAMPMSHGEAQRLVADYIYPTLRNAGLDTKIMCWDHSYTTTNYRDGSYPFVYYVDANAFAATDGSAWHWYEGDEEVMSVVHKEYPTKDIWFTEGSGGEWGFPKWKTAFLNQSSCIINIARNWSKSVILWNLALDENGGPDYYYDVNQHQDSTNRGLITIQSSGDWFCNVDYYTLGHISKFVEPNAVRIDSTSLDDNIETVAFRNPDGSKVLVMTNLMDVDQLMKIRWGDQSLNYTIPSESMVTMKWNGSQSGSAMQPIWFNNLEHNNKYSVGTNASASETDSTANLGGSKGIKLTTSENGDPGNGSQCAVIEPQNGNSIDASGYQYLTFSVKDMVNPDNCTVKVTFVDQDGTTVSKWSHESTVYGNWARIQVPIAGGYGFDRQHIAQIKLGFYWRGDYYIDDLFLSNACADGTPMFGEVNYVVNGSFEDDGSVIVNPAGWHFEGGNPESTYLEKNSNAASGRFHLVHYSAQSHDAYTWQVIYNLENGTYTLRAMVQSGGGQIQNKILATDFGGSEMSAAIPVNSHWTQVEISNVQVTNGQCTVAFYTKGNPGDWSCADNIELIKN